MKVTRLHLARFLGYEDLEIHLAERISIFVGPNGAGKSSILDGIRVALTGTVAGVARKDAAQLQYLGKGKPWAVELDLGERTIRRTATTLSVMEDDRAVKLNQTDLDSWVRDRAALAALLDVGHALRMTPAERQDLVFRLAGISVTAEDLEARGLRNPAIRDHALRGNWKRAESEAAERKRAAGRELSDLMIVPPQDREVALTKPTPLSAIDDETLRKMRGRVADLENKEREIEREIGRLEGRTAASTDGLEERLAEVRAQIASLEERDPAREHAAVVARIGTGRKVLTEAREATAKLEQQQREIEDASRAAGEEIKRLRGAGTKHVCSICGLEHEGKVQTAAIETLREDITGLETTAAELAAKIQEDRTAEAGIVGKLESLKSERDRLAAEDARAVALRKEAGEIEARMSVPPVGKGEITDLEDTLAAVREKLERGRAIVREVDQYRQDVTAWENAVRRREKLAREVEDFRVMETRCRPEGVRAELLAPVLGPIRERLASWAPLLDGLDVTLTDDFEVEVTRQGHPMRLSGSEGWRVSMVLADALAQLSALRWLCLDEMSLLDPGNRRAVTRLLARLEEDYDQVLICSVLGEVEPRQAPPASGVRVYRVGDGRAVAMADAEAA